jgi:hypothetical protein
MGRTTTSIRIDDDLRDQLISVAAAEGTTVTAVIERFVREGLIMARHPGIIFNSGPSGRRATLASGPDVWEVVSALRRFREGSEADRIAALAREFGLHPRQVRIALTYAAAYPEETEARIRANDRALEEAERIVAERSRLLA